MAHVSRYGLRRSRGFHEIDSGGPARLTSSEVGGSTSEVVSKWYCTARLRARARAQESVT